MLSEGSKGIGWNTRTIETTDNGFTATPPPDDKLDMRVCACDILEMVVNVGAEVGRGSPVVTELED